MSDHQGRDVDEDRANVEYTSALPLGYVDIFVFSSFLGLLFYWFFVRKRKQDTSTPAASVNG